MKISTTEETMLEVALRTAFNSVRAVVTNQFSLIHGDSAITWGVSWAGEAAESAASAKAFADNLMTAARVVDGLNAMNLEITDTDDAGQDLTKDDYEALVNEWAAAFRDGSLRPLDYYLRHNGLN